MVTVIRDATVVTGDAGRTILYDPALAVVGDKIDAVGPTEEIVAGHQDAEIIDVRVKAVFPYMPHAFSHNHIARLTSGNLLAGQRLGPLHQANVQFAVDPIACHAQTPDSKSSGSNYSGIIRRA